MKPVAIIRFSPGEGPGHLAEFLDSHAIPWRLIGIDVRDEVPADASQFSGIAMMGGPMSVNDGLPWMPPLFDLIRSAVAMDIPLIGHCLGGQLMAKALGGAVTDNRCKEMGWHDVEVVNALPAHRWFGDLSRFTVFQWHYQTFSIPPGGVRVLGNGYCDNQAFVLGPHIGFQCHIEMTAAMVQDWCSHDAEEIAAAAGSDSVQTAGQILCDLEPRVARLNEVADRIYTRWISGLR